MWKSELTVEDLLEETLLENVEAVTEHVTELEPDSEKHPW